MSEQPGSPSRYARTFQGLVASMIVTVLVVVVVFLLLRLDNGGAEQGVATVDYGQAVEAAADAGVEVVYPARTPQGWRATSVSLDPTGSEGWGIGFLTEDGRFAGVRQAPTGPDELDDLLTTYVDEDPVQGDDVSVDSPLATTWTTWSDAGGDHAYSTQTTVQGRSTTLLVYGSATTADLRTLLDSLVLSTADVVPAG